MSLPAADDLFRPTVTTVPEPRTSESAETPRSVRSARSVRSEQEDGSEATRRPSGRVRHDEKMTVYVTADELLGIEQARLTLRREHGLAVDRGRLVREAVALVLAELDEQGGTSALVRRLSGP